MRKRRGYLQKLRGISKVKVLIVLAVLLGIGIVGYFIKPWEKLGIRIPGVTPTITKPEVDVGRGRQLTVKPEKDYLIQVFDGQKVVANLNIPKGAVNKPTTVEVMPFIYDKKALSPTLGVLVSPGNISFLKPVTLSFDLSRSSFRNDAPESVSASAARVTGKSQVLFLDKDATSLTPTLVLRSSETSTHLSAMILTGGAYVFSLDGADQVNWARKALSQDDTNALVVLESASVLLNNNQKLSAKEQDRVEFVIDSMIAKRDDFPIEASVAYSVQKKLNESSTSLVETVYAQAAIRQYYETLCKFRGGDIETYLAIATSAEIFGYSDIGEKCIIAAKNEVIRQGRQYLANSNNPAELVAFLSKVQLVGVDVESNLDENLLAKIRDISILRANELLSDPNATATQLAKALQDASNYGAPEDVINKLSDKILEKIEQGDIPKPSDPSPSPGTQDDEEMGLVARVSLGAIGIALWQGLGLESFDQAGIQNWVDKAVAGGRELEQVVAAACAAAGLDCSAQLAEASRLMQQATEEGYRVASQLGDIQAQDFQVPDDLGTDYEPLFPDEPEPLDIPEEILEEEPVVEDETPPAGEEPVEEPPLEDITE